MNTSLPSQPPAALPLQELMLLRSLYQATMPETPSPEFDAAIYMLGNDDGKTRMNKSTAMQDRLTWKIMTLSTGEVSSATALNGIGKTRRGGQ